MSILDQFRKIAVATPTAAAAGKKDPVKEFIKNLDIQLDNLTAIRGNKLAASGLRDWWKENKAGEGYILKFGRYPLNIDGDKTWVQAKDLDQVRELLLQAKKGAESDDEFKKLIVDKAEETSANLKAKRAEGAKGKK